MEWIDTIDKQITTVDKDAFKNLENLREIAFFVCKIQYIHKEAFKGSNKLKIVYLSNSNLTDQNQGELKKQYPQIKFNYD